MSNTIGTIFRVLWLMAWLIAGWFIGVTALYILTITILSIPFNGIHLWIVFGSVIALRMFYPRNVFTW